jgi:uncharacterized membrane protein YfcA
MEKSIWYILLGLTAGTLSGLIGIGGGTIIVPVLVFMFGFSLHQAQGTTFLKAGGELLALCQL